MKSKHVKVVVRTRPTSDFANDILQISPETNSIHIHIPKNSESGFINNQQEDWDFKFDQILHNASQECIFDECGSPILKSLIDGYNGTILAYGQTGAGKTYTMTGTTENYVHRGLIPRIISQLYKEISNKTQMAITVRISYLEIYNEQMVDLLASLNDDETCTGALKIVDENIGPSLVKNLSLQIANTEEEALNLLFEGETNKSISEHQLNKNSSRSHCIFTIYLESRSRVESSEKVIYSKLNLVDLAGSERLSKTQTSGVSLQEAKYINKSLTFLEQVIIALSDKKRDHIPYRQSKLTNVLRDALGGNCNTLMIANIWGVKEHIEETISTLRFGTRMMCVANTPVVNVQYDPMALIKKYEREIKELKHELSMHDILNSKMNIQYEPYNDNQKYELRKQIKSYIENENEEIPIINVRQIKEIFNQFRKLYINLETENEENSKLLKHNANLNNQQANGNNDNSKQEHENNSNKSNSDKDDGVGDIEGGGFGIGVAPNGKTGKNTKEKSKKKGQSKVSSATNNASEKEKQEENLESSSQIFNSDPNNNNNTNNTNNTNDQESKLQELPLIQKVLNKENASSNFGSRVSFSPPNRSEEFEIFKRGNGAEMNKILTENKVILKEKKKIAKGYAECVNKIKAQIDDLRDIINKKKNDRNFDTNNTREVLDEDEFHLMQQMQILKQHYRSKYDSLKNCRVEVEYCLRLVDQCRQKLMQEFEAWYDSLYGSHIAESEGVATKINNSIGDQSKFKLDKINNQDSYTYYRAKKNVDKKNIRQTILKGRHSKIPPIPSSKTISTLI
ncbi:kinesin-domain-containing protein [Neocallimastix lanati (nom. inval.)]|jgi:kinesin family protein 6/9|uniref:Kinesin-like protein n=1 Tax=Neocallimastix californiae TaxID=1754190 RepID=A0A1Y2C2N7_9FUNG|nr:kinesin-domain-containing protein [Neocallimastix sp. JGI-2020a]ORY40575.1 kinesin-domain-containing protein [Neocallimastix californiae]|eukprot:ORY40575.1 kinesin-domain-containing protein [Neocallimastix californiae]